MKLRFDWEEGAYEIDTNEAIHLSLPLRSGLQNQPNAFFAPPYEAEPHRSGDFVGSIEAGSPVNFYNIKLNPHGNGTHTECVGHILKGPHYVTAALSTSLCIANLTTVIPARMPNGDRQVLIPDLSAILTVNPDALIVRTVPNRDDKRLQKYSGSNPPYFSEQSMKQIAESQILHLLTDLPSVDREEDGGALTNHKIFWSVEESPRFDRTITEMLFIGNQVEDGLYLLDLQIAPLELDASPSNPVIYKLKQYREN